MDEKISLAVKGDAILINEEVFDFSRLQDGDTLPCEAIASQWFAGDVKRVDGVLHVALVFPHGPHADDAARFPVPITVTQDGPVQLPDSGHDSPELPLLLEPVAEDAV
ncbi:MAG: hypothetical protein RR800_00315 [Comamonas sp.]